MKINLVIVVVLLVSGVFYSCESEAEKQTRLAKIEIDRIEQEKQLVEEKKVRAIQKAIEDSLQAIKLEQERKEKEIYDKYIDNSLRTGATPYSYCFGSNGSCNDYGCSKIKVITPYNSDVLVIIKRNGKVNRHAYIKSNSSYTFECANGTYQPFFYYGKGWNPNKFMKETDCGTLKGGFITDELFGKDSPQYLSNNILTYELILQQDGNFSTIPSSKNEAF